MNYQVVKIYILLFLTFIIEVSAKSNVRINESFRDIPLKEALTILKEKYELKIAYGDHAVSDIRLNMDIQSLAVYETFEKMLASTPLTFELLEEDVIIVKKKPKRENVEDATFTVIGVVRDASSGERLPYAYVWLENENRNHMANVDGYFSISEASLPATLRISYLGYQDTTLHIDDRSVNKRLYVDRKSVV